MASETAKRDAFGEVIGPRFYDGPKEGIFPEVYELASKRDGWKPDAWHRNILRLADQCQWANPDRARDLRAAARLMECK